MKTNRTQKDELDYLKDFLLRNGIEPFWASSAIVWVRRAMAGNTHWATDLKRPRVCQSNAYKGVVKRLSVHCTLHSTTASVPGKIVYTFRPGRGGHKVHIKAV
jgi:hypothetical protein